MKQPNEKELKRLLEEQLEQDGKLGSAGGDDIGLYLLLFTALADEPAMPHNMDLAESVIKQIKAAELKKESVQYNMLIIFVLIAGTVSAYFAINYINPPVLKSALNFILEYKWIAIFIILCLGIIEIADKNFVKRRSVESTLIH